MRLPSFLRHSTPRCRIVDWGSGKSTRPAAASSIIRSVSVLKPLLLPLLSAVLLAVGPLSAHDQTHTHPAGEQLGTVHFETSCTPAAQAGFDRAVSLLHSFEFGSAISSFEAILQTDPSCAMTEWGIALSQWGNPFGMTTRGPEQLRTGRAAIERARAIGAKTDRERAYIDAAANLYAD